MAKRSILILANRPMPSRATPHVYSEHGLTKPLYDGPIGIVPIVIDFDGTRVTVGTVDESKLPPCAVCARPIPLDVVVAASSRNQPSLFCGRDCRLTSGMRESRARQRVGDTTLTPRIKAAKKTTEIAIKAKVKSPKTTRKAKKS